MKLETLAVHGGYRPDPTTRAVAVPIYQTVAYAFDDTQHGADLFDLKVPGNIYTRIMNPTQDVLEQRLAALEGGVGALALASGQAAVTYAIQTIAEAGDNIISASTLYGGTYNLFAHTLPQFGITTRFADAADPESFGALIDERGEVIGINSQIATLSGAQIALALGWQASGLVDMGKFTVDEVEHSGAPDTITLRARSANLIDTFKQQQEHSFHKTTLGAIIEAIAFRNELASGVSARLRDIAIEHIDQTHESDAAFLRRLGRKYDAPATA